MNQLYSGLRPQQMVKARGELLTQRNRECATGDTGCLRKQYGDRIDQLQALNAAAAGGTISWVVSLR